MANQNLSQFTEKTFVADADWVFVWDTADAISKKVSRNSLLNSGTLATSAPVTISQTWNDAAVAFTAFKVNATTPGTTSASGSLLLDLQVGGVSQFNVRKSGQALATSGAASAPGFAFIGETNTGVYQQSSGLQFSSAGTNVFGVRNEVRVNGSVAFGFASGTPADTGLDVALWRDGAPNTLALRNSTAAQTFNVYGTYTSGTSYERLTLSAPSAANAIIGTNKGSGGGTARGLDLHTDGAARMTIGTTGNVGIGTTAPTSNLEVVSTTSASIAVRSGTNTFDGCYIVGTGQYESVYDARVSGNASGSRVIRFGNVNGGNFTFRALADIGETVLRTPVSISNTAPTGSLYILGSGNVGIGTTAPVAKLHLTGGDSTSGFTNATIALSFQNTASYSQFIHTRHNDGTAVGNAIDFYTSTGSSVGVYPTHAVHGMTIENGKVGIGTTAPSSKLHVAETWNASGTTFAAAKIVVTDTASAVGSDFLELYSGSATQPLRMDINKTGQINFYGTWTDASNYERFSIIPQSSGSVLIGTNKSGGSSVVRGMEFQIDGVSKWAINASGNLLTLTDNQNDIGTQSSGFRPRNIYVAGDFETTTASKGIILKSPDGTRYRITVPNGGTVLTITAV
jgi:hypothetical protein